jgi:hypothetical protein
MLDILSTLRAQLGIHSESPRAGPNVWIAEGRRPIP